MAAEPQLPLAPSAGFATIKLVPIGARRTLAGIAIGGAALAVAITASAQNALDGLGDDKPVLHEEIEPPGDGVNSRQPLYGEPKEHQNPTAFENHGKILPEPPANTKAKKSEPVHGRGGFAADRDTEYRGDLSTGADGTLHYVSVFNPSILPFKRMSALDTVREDFTMYSGERSLTDVPVGGAQSPNRDLFWGSLMLELKPGRDVPIPSVAPDMRVLSYEVKPHTKLVFSKDGADNYYVRSDEADASGTYRLVFLVDANARYFAPRVPDGYLVRDVARRAKHLLRPMPASVRASALRAVEQFLHVDGKSKLRTALDTLVYYFRDFQAKASPPATTSIYWDLLSNKVGVCRHRSFTFMITANALGIPTRYVANEAHAWVEVWLPETKWVRVDLGGAALRMDVSGAEDKSIYRPRGKDPFVQPPSYKKNYTQLEGDIGGLSDDQRAEAREPIDDPGRIGDDDDDDGTDPGPRRVGPGRKLPSLPQSAFQGRIRTAIEVLGASSIGYRGESIQVRGKLTAGGKPVAGQRVDIYLAPQGMNGEYAELIGHAITESDGHYLTKVDLPMDLELRSYEVFASTPGDAKYSPAVSE